MERYNFVLSGIEADSQEEAEAIVAERFGDVIQTWDKPWDSYLLMQETGDFHELIRSHVPREYVLLNVQREEAIA